ncbi:MAG: heparinase [Candidatus Eisenbacteria bacterium]|nr:heparinase [Candidatus Eisenbacteria bacterium]
MDPGRYIRTLRYLRGRQVLVRILRNVTPDRFDTSGPPDPRGRSGETVPPIARPVEWLSPTRVRLLNVEKEFDGGIDWRSKEVPRLWVYHLHYFADLPGRADDESSRWLGDVVRSWIASNPPGTPDAWDPYPTSLRIMNLVKWLLRLGNGEGAEVVSESLAVQTRHLERSIEFDVSANHLFANACALTIAGLFFGGDEGDRWLSRGTSILDREMREQVLPDGGHYERSPMYHAIVLEQALDVLNVWSGAPDAGGKSARRLRQRLEAAAGRMLSWLEKMAHPDGDVSFFNDSTIGVAPTLGELRAYGARLGLEPAETRGPERAGRSSTVTRLAESGYFRLVSEDGQTVVLFDAGSIGPDHQPGHGHCDGLSFEVSRRGRRVLVNSGISTYEPGPERLRQRRTEAHNTVRIDGEEQCEVWSAHRCGRRHGILEASAEADSAGASHSGFAHLPGSPIHHRTVELTDRGVRVRDGFDGEGEHLVEWFLRLHPEIGVEPGGGGFDLLLDGERVGALRIPPELSPTLSESTWHPGFNLSEPCPLVTASWRGRLPRDFEFELLWK